MGGFSFSHSLALAACLHGLTFITMDAEETLQAPPSTVALHIKLGTNFGNAERAPAVDKKTLIAAFPKQEKTLERLEPSSTISPSAKADKNKPSLIRASLTQDKLNQTIGKAPTAKPALPSPPKIQAQPKPKQFIQQASAKGSPLGNSMAEDAKYLESYTEVISSWLQRFRQYPKTARQLNQEGVAVIQIDITPKGEVRDYYIVESSGYALLDQAALDAVRFAKSVPAAPENYPSDDIMGFEIPMTFTLETDNNT